MSKKNFKADIRLDEHDFIPEVDLREELKRRLHLNIIDGELYDRVIECFENNIPVSSLFAENIRDKPWLSTQYNKSFSLDNVKNN